MLYFNAGKKIYSKIQYLNALLQSFANVLKRCLRTRVASVFVAMASVRERRVAMDGGRYTLEEFVHRYGWDDGERFWAASGATQPAAATTPPPPVQVASGATQAVVATTPAHVAVGASQPAAANIPDTAATEPSPPPMQVASGATQVACLHVLN